MKEKFPNTRKHLTSGSEGSFGISEGSITKRGKNKPCRPGEVTRGKQQHPPSVLLCVSRQLSVPHPRPWHLVAVPSLSSIRLSATPCTAARHASPCLTVSPLSSSFLSLLLQQQQDSPGYIFSSQLVPTSPGVLRAGSVWVTIICHFLVADCKRR